MTGVDGYVRRVKSVVDYAISGTVYRVESDWTIRNGAAEVKAKITASGKPFEPAHLGFCTVFDKPCMKVDWLGCGPWENYADRKSGAFLGIWARSRGLGGNSCGPLPLERDRIKGGPVELDFIIR